MAAASYAATRDVNGPKLAHADQTEIDALLRRLIDRDRAPQAEVAPLEVKTPAVQEPHPRRDFDMASELLDRASQAFDLLIGRCQRLERGLDEVDERAREQAAEHEVAVDQWKRLASGLKAQLDAAELAAADLRTRCDAAEARAAMAESRAAALERASAQAAGQAALAESLSTKLHDKVVSAFGIGSRAHPVLEAVATHQAAE